LGLAYIAAVLEQSGYFVDIIDANAERISSQKAAQRAINLSADFVGITAVTPTINICNDIAKEIKKLDSSILIAIGGVHATILPQETMRNCPNYDYLIKGEGEYILKELLEVLNSNRYLGDIKGIGYRNRDNIIINEGQGIIEDLNKLPFPARHLLNNKLYRTFDSSRMTSMIAMRGCAAKCIYCAVNLIAGKICRRRDPINIAEEIKLCISKYSVRFVSFLDDTFTFDKAWTHLLCSELIRNKLNRRIKWSCLTRVDNIDLPLLRHLKEAGCVRVEFGIESGSQELLNYLKKGITLFQIKEAFRQAKGIGLSTMGFVMLNIPGETRETVLKTKKLIHEVEPDFLQVSFTTPYPGTELFDLCIRNDSLLTKDWSRYIFLSWQIIKNKNISEEEFKKLIWDIERSYYLRPKYILFILLYMLKHPARIKTMLWAGANAFKELVFKTK
jgi:radical SAM superfamily enzyme YgiQ (UPF0313 family)